MFLAINDHELVALVSTVLSIFLTVLKFVLERKKKDDANECMSAWTRFKRGVIILLVGFFIGVATCFHLFVNTDWKAKKAFQRFLKKQKQSFHRPR